MGSQLTIPLDLIPITMQTVSVMLIGLIFKRKQAIQIIMVYLFLGAIGVPVFANFKSGLKCLYGPSAGYLWGFLIAVIVMTTLNKKTEKPNIIYITLNCLLGTAIILLCGFFWLTYYVGLNTAINSGLYPFITPGIIKVILAAAIARLLCYRKLI